MASTHWVAVSARKRTEQSAMREAVAIEERWWADIGFPSVRAVAVRAERRPRGWRVAIALVPSSSSDA